MADSETNTHRNSAAFHLFEMGRDYDPHRPEWDSEPAGTLRTEYRYLVQLAHRRSQSSCVLVAIEKIAATLAVADGLIWPRCDNNISTDRADLQKLAMAAQRRQRYRHVARLVHSELMNYYELGTDGEDYRQNVIMESQLQVVQDKQIVSEHRRAIGVPIVSGLKDGDK